MGSLGNRMRIAAALVLAAGSAAAAAEKVTFKRVYPPGRYEITATTKMQQVVTMQGNELPAQTTTSMMVVEAAVSKPDAKGNTTMTLTYTRIRQTTTTPMGDLVYDSAGKPEEQDPHLGMGIAPMMKAKLTVIVDRDGKPVKLTGLDEIWDEMAKRNPQMKPLVEQMKKQVGDQMVNSLLGTQTNVIPDKPLGVGEKWSSESEVAVPIVGTLKMRTTTHLVDVSSRGGRQVATLKLDGDLESQKEGKFEMGPVQMVFTSMKFKQTGTMLYDVPLGLTTSISLTQTGKMSGSVTLPSGETMPYASDQTVEMKTTVAPKTDETPTTQPAAKTPEGTGG